MQLHEIKRNNKNYKSAQVGRGKARGKTSGRGTKGQKARAGNKTRPAIRDVIKKLPKMRGRGKSAFKSITPKPLIVTLDAINKNYQNGDVVSREKKKEKKVISSVRGRVTQMKVLGTGTLDKKVTVEGLTASKSAKEAIEKAGGSVK